MKDGNNAFNFCRRMLFLTSIAILLTASTLVSNSRATALTALTDGAWAEYVAARNAAELVGTGLAAGGAAYSSIAGQSWVLDKAKVPVLPADIQFDSTSTNRWLNKTALRSNLLATASATSTANINGVIGTGIAATWGGVADAWAGAGKKYMHSGSKLKNRVAGKLVEMVLDPFPLPPEDLYSSALTGLNIPVADILEIDVQAPDSTTWTPIFEAKFSLFWNSADNFWDLSVDDPTGQFTKSDFSMSNQLVYFDALGQSLPSTIWTLNTEKSFFADFWTTSNLQEDGTAWGDGTEFGTQLKIGSEGVTTAVPEPSTLLLACSGLVGFLIRNRAHRKRRAMA